MSNSCSLDVFGQCPILSICKYPIKSKDVQLCPKLSKVIQEYPAFPRNAKFRYFHDSSACTGCPWACFSACIRSRDTTGRPTLCRCHMCYISLHHVCTMNQSSFPLLPCICDRFRCKSL